MQTKVPDDYQMRRRAQTYSTSVRQPLRAVQRSFEETDVGSIKEEAEEETEEERRKRVRRGGEGREESGGGGRGGGMEGRGEERGGGEGGRYTCK